MFKVFLRMERWKLCGTNAEQRNWSGQLLKLRTPHSYNNKDTNTAHTRAQIKACHRVHSIARVQNISILSNFELTFIRFLARHLSTTASSMYSVSTERQRGIFLIIFTKTHRPPTLSTTSHSMHEHKIVCNLLTCPFSNRCCFPSLFS